jgi:hypothetical protein
MMARILQYSPVKTSRAVDDGQQSIEKGKRISMPHCLVLFAPSQPLSGIAPLARRVVGGLVSGGCDVSVALAKKSHGFPSSEPIAETYTTSPGQLEIVWWPEDISQFPQRQDLVWAIEQHHDRREIDLIIAIDSRCGFCATVAARLCKTQVAAYVTYRDTFETHFRESQELDVLARHAHILFSCNPQVLRHVSMFHDLDDRLRLMDPRPTASELSCQQERSDDASDSDYIVTTGVLNHLVRFDDLMARVQQHFRQGVERWIHVGSCNTNTLVKIDRHLVTLGQQDRLKITERVPRERYVDLLLGSRCHVIPEGERNTNLSVYESQAWGVPLDVAGDFPFPTSLDEVSAEQSTFTSIEPRELLEMLPI